MDSQGGIHEENPFVAPVEERDPARRFRGRLAAPVTVITSGDDDRTGQTVSSLVIAEGDPPLVYFLVSETSDLLYAIRDTGRFVVHICEDRHRALADEFAGLRPAPGGPFSGKEVVQTEYGPELLDLGTRAYCSWVGDREESFSVMVRGAVDHFELHELDRPLSYFRGRYRTLGDGPVDGDS